MDVWRITLAALRRWYVLVPLLALTGVIVLLSGRGVAPEYEARTAAMVTPERAATEIPNPYGSITGANAALGIVLNSVETRRAVQAQGLDPSYEVGAQTRSTIMQIAIRADTPEAAEQTGLAVLELARQELATRQTEAGLPEAAQLTLAVLEPPAVTGVVQTGKARVQAVVGVLGAGLSLLIAVLFDDILGLVRRMRSKRHAQRPDGERSDDEQADAHELEIISSEKQPAGRPRPEPEPAKADGSTPPGDSEPDLEPSYSNRQRRARYEVARRP